MSNIFNNKIEYGYYYNDYSEQEPILDSKEFALCEIQARKFLRGLCTSSIPEEYIDDYFSCVCAIAEKIHTQKPAGVKSESIDGYSVTYAEDSISQKELYKTAIHYLGDLGVLYQGVD